MSSILDSFFVQSHGYNQMEEKWNNSLTNCVSNENVENAISLGMKWIAMELATMMLYETK